MVTRTRLDVMLYVHCLSCCIVFKQLKKLIFIYYYYLFYYYFFLLLYYIYYLLQTAGPSGRSPAEIVDSNPTGSMDVSLL